MNIKERATRGQIRADGSASNEQHRPTYVLRYANAAGPGEPCIIGIRYFTADIAIGHAGYLYRRDGRPIEILYGTGPTDKRPVFARVPEENHADSAGTRIDG